MISVPLWVVWRIALVLLGFYLIGIALAVLYFYRRAYRLVGGAIPWHVMIVASSYLLLVTQDMYTHFERLTAGVGFTTQLLVSIVAYVLGIAAMRKVLGYERRVERLYGRRKDDVKR